MAAQDGVCEFMLDKSPATDLSETFIEPAVDALMTRRASRQTCARLPVLALAWQLFCEVSQRVQVQLSTSFALERM